MKLDDIAKMAIDEVNAELENIQALEEKKPVFQIKTTEEIQTTPTKEEVIEKSDIEEEIEKILPSEEIFLNNLKERIEVLFEGLNETSQQNLENRLELTLKFLEFTLANVENRLQNITK
ncbi:hypothetical protein CPIN18021_0874 [Campylobacter pinnipediorum subsp. caledonicus]|uniref:Campylobacter invasion antigen D C-terminal domain-containing protein n=1 Tax=Campylobacter pinnipediorum subsp. caledonicus TaxID=1874362 RepID=A0A1S6U7I3_9BACT|nr:hypothetical protein [Campylobacter pinnipediorum]AQW86076.1 hypothetical protein CPIN18020_0871 [Campylobacter pinnipediorum subsp. caledonicus]AQW87683.1 hypothetical protein CPIN18021_0874 [Campylobacter pinnipediorum subsp. caledonicus]OPA72188.1 hypothetical protein BB381_01130 [Campylobacter pinnipediorum subsp. caledonicus]